MPSNNQTPLERVVAFREQVLGETKIKKMIAIKESVIDLLATLSRSELMIIADHYELPGSKSASKKQLQDGITTWTVGAHLRSCAIQGEASGYTYN